MANESLIEVNQAKLDEFLENRQVALNRPLNVFDYLEAVSDFYQTIDGHDDCITDEDFKRHKSIVKSSMKFAMKIMKEFGIKETDGCLIGCFKE